MGYRLGVDVGTTFTAAAVDDGSGPRMLGLGNRALQVPSVLFLQADGSFLFGEAAERRGNVEPATVVREFKRRFGDTVPILVAGQPFSPQALTARLLSFVVAIATEREGSAPDEVVLTHPANWGGYKRELMDQVIAMADLSSALTCTEPEAAAIQYASRAGLAEDAKVAVFDLGGGTFDICVLQKQQTGFRILGAPEGVEHLGGIDFDEAVFQHVLRGLGEAVTRLDLDDPQVTADLTRLRRDCVDAKEALSNDVDTAIPVHLPGVSTTVRLTRAELESLIAPALRDTLDATHRALRSAHISPDELAAIVLVGGSSRIPLVSHLLNSEFGVPTAMDTHPKHDIALGAVQYHPRTPDQAAPLPAPTVEKWPSRQPVTVLPPPSDPSEPEPDLVSETATQASMASPPVLLTPPPPRPVGRSRGPGLRTSLIAAGAVAAVAAVIIATVSFAGGGDDGGPGASESSQTTTEPGTRPTSATTHGPSDDASEVRTTPAQPKCRQLTPSLDVSFVLTDDDTVAGEALWAHVTARNEGDESVDATFVGHATSVSGGTRNWTGTGTTLRAGEDVVLDLGSDQPLPVSVAQVANVEVTAHMSFPDRDVPCQVAVRNSDPGNVHPTCGDADEQDPGPYPGELTKDATLAVQRQLNYLGYQCTVTDGDFGTETSDLVREFQSDNGLFVDGQVGEETWDALFNE